MRVTEIVSYFRFSFLDFHSDEAHSRRHPRLHRLHRPPDARCRAAPCPDRFNVIALAAGNNVTLLEEQAREFRPRFVCAGREDDYLTERVSSRRSLAALGRDGGHGGAPGR